MVLQVEIPQGAPARQILSVDALPRKFPGSLDQILEVRWSTRASSSSSWGRGGRRRQNAMDDGGPAPNGATMGENSVALADYAAGLA